MIASTDSFKERLAVKASIASQFGVYKVPPKPNWLALYLLRMNIIALDRNNTLDVLTDDEVRGMIATLELNLQP